MFILSKFIKTTLLVINSIKIIDTMNSSHFIALIMKRVEKVLINCIRLG